MIVNELINIKCFGEAVRKVGFDEQKKKSFFQHNPSEIVRKFCKTLKSFINKREL